MASSLNWGFVSHRKPKIWYNIVMRNALDEFSAAWSASLPHPLTEGDIAISSLTGAADAFLAAHLAKDGNTPRVVLALTAGLPEAERLTDDLRLVTERLDCRVMNFPSLLEDDAAALGARIKVLAALREAKGDLIHPLIIVAGYPALATPVPTATVTTLTLSTQKADAANSFSSVKEALVSLGYNRVPLVEKEGDWSLRGGIIDAWCPGEEFPIRLEYFGEELESLRLFDSASQRSIKAVTEATLAPIKLAETNETTSFFTLLPRAALILALEHNAYTLPEEAKGLRTVFTGDPPPPDTPTVPFQTVPLPGFAELGADEAHHPELFVAARKRLDTHLTAAKLRGTCVIEMPELSCGFELPNLIVCSQADRAYTKRVRRVRRRANPNMGARLDDFDNLEPGEYVVHIDYGIGRYLGSSEILMDGKRTEVFTIEYADHAKLHIPAAHAHLLSRYVGVKGETVKLHRLDGARWTKDKLAAQRAVADLAAALLDTQAKRETVPGYAYTVPCEGLEAFEADFPYDETPDQEAAIAAIKEDLAKTRPMDRLICGDAGYGKTEVAMRAAYIAALNGKQVAVLAPTTVLAEQHFETFTVRFEGSPVRIESLSRFQSLGTREGTLQRLASRTCDIVIGTHALLSERVRFKDLGLIIVDEEQRFGVRHKEFLKHLRATADVLTLSATPIPRTLYLSMTGARDLSLLRTPPRERVAVETIVARDNDLVIAQAIEKEKNRGGQTFFLHNRVTSLPRVKARLEALCPNIKIIVAHGQMESRTLARIMHTFEQGKADVLLSTTIIESGIDIPRANTILVDRADTFGLADLYQLRGRVGRSTVPGRAIFLLPPTGIVDAEARERLAALKRHGGLGAGFNLAVRDLELRGAGDLLGARQSGHIAAVGFTLYCQLLKRAIAQLKGEELPEIAVVNLNLDFIDTSPASDDAQSAAMIPYSYIEEDVQRLSFMKRLAEASQTKDIKKLREELLDRYGPLPAATTRLLVIAQLRVLSTQAKLSRIDTRENKVFLRDRDQQIVAVLELKGKTADAKLTEIRRAVKSRLP